MPWLAALAPIIGALGQAGASGYGAYQAGNQELDMGQTQIPGWTRGLQSMFSRMIAQNATQQGPSFGDYVGSGGKAQFPVNFTGMTPQESRFLDFVGPDGEPIPYTDIGRQGTEQPPGELTPAQRLFMGQQDLRHGRSNQIAKLAERVNKAKAFGAQLKNPNLSIPQKARIERKSIRQSARAEDLYNRIMRMGHGSGDQYSGDPSYNKPPGRYEVGVDEPWGNAKKRNKSGGGNNNWWGTHEDLIKKIFGGGIFR
jgi:hypothetical protein